MWLERPLAELAAITSGGTPERDVAAYWGGDIPWVTPSDITACGKNVLWETKERITERGLAASAARLVPAHSVLLTSRATVGEARMAGMPVCTNQGFKSLTANPGLDPWFLFYQVQRCRSQFERFAAGSTFLEIGKRDTERVPILHPASVEEQQRIAAVLTSIDNAIEATEALIEKHQQIKAGLMHDLLSRGVDAVGQLRPSPESAAHLYRETPVGRIPLDWEVLPLERCLDSSPKNGYSPREVDDWQGVYVLGLACLTPSGFEPRQLKRAPRKLSLASGAVLNDGDFLLSRANTPSLVGLCGIYRGNSTPTIFPDLMMRLTLNASMNKQFLEMQLLSPATRNRLTALAVGTSSSMAKLNANSLSRFKVCVPSPMEQVHIVQRFQPVSTAISALAAMLAKLRAQKLGLMQDLLTGKVRVPAAPAATAHA